MKIYKITGASEYLGVSINTLKTLANNGKIKSLEFCNKVCRHSDDCIALREMGKKPKGA